MTKLLIGVTKLLISVVMIAVLTAGCAEQNQDEPVRILQPPMHWSDLVTTTAAAVTQADNGYINLVPQGTQGVFPASVAIARLVVDPQSSPGQREIIMNMKPANDFLSWNRLFDNLPYISEVFPLNPRDLAEQPARPQRILEAARELTADLCLIYGISDLSATETEIRGVLYWTKTDQPLATIHARAWALDPEVVPRPPELAKGDQRHCDPRVLTVKRFEDLALKAVLDLHGHDHSLPPQTPEGWIPDQPLEPRIWPPIPITTDPYRNR